jgi:hypothetical protein
MSVGFFPLSDYFSHVGVGDFFIDYGIFEGIGSIFGEEKIDDNTHENVENEHVGVSVFEDHESGCEKDPDDNHEGDHRDDFLNHAHIGAAFLIFVENGQSVSIEVELGIKVDKAKEVNQGVGCGVEHNDADDNKVQGVGVSIAESVIDGVLAFVFDFDQFVVGESGLKQVQNLLPGLYQVGHEAEGGLVEDEQVVEVAVDFLVNETEQLDPAPACPQDVQ